MDHGSVDVIIRGNGENTSSQDPMFLPQIARFPPRVGAVSENCLSFWGSMFSNLAPLLGYFKLNQVDLTTEHWGLKYLNVLSPYTQRF